MTQSLASLRRLHINPFFPIERVVDTMSALAASPVESVRIECFAEDVVDVCARVEEFLTLREGARAAHCAKCAAQSPPAATPRSRADGSRACAPSGLASPTRHLADPPTAMRMKREKEERRAAARHLEALCAGFRLGGIVQDETPRLKIRSKTVEETGVVAPATDVRRGKGRAMTL